MGRQASTKSPAHPPKPPDPVSGARRPADVSSSPMKKGDRESQQAKKKVRSMNLNHPAGFEDVLVKDVTREEAMHEEGQVSDSIPPTKDAMNDEEILEDQLNDSQMHEKIPKPNAWTE
ncbi:hypothetical protein LINGRAHAP2_LOCUS24986 [Linum grandiflorum]